MRAIETPIQKCFSSDNMLGSYYHEYNESNFIKHTVHQYDELGNYIMHSTRNINEIPQDNYYVSDRFGNKI